MMYLSRVEIDKENRQKIKDLNHLGAYHSWVEECFPHEISEETRSRKLWRIDQLNGKEYLLIVSRNQPDKQRLEKYGVGESGQTKDYTPLLNSIKEGQRLRFRATLNPVQSIHTGDENQKRGRIVPHITHNQQLKFLIDRAEKNGFLLNVDEVTIVGRNYSILKKSGSRGVRISQVSYEGVLTVTDVEKFTNILIHGLGKKKAYGCGLVTVIPGE